MSPLDGVPDEIIRHILHFIAPQDILDSVQCVSRRLYRVAKEPLLWRWLCLESFKYWHPDHRIEARVRAPAPTTDWRAIWIARTKKNARIARLMEGILSTSQNRIKRMQNISALGYDAKDFLLGQLHCDESEQDALSRRYYAGVVLDSLHKGIAIDLWHHYQGGDAPRFQGLDRALAAFDLCVVRDQPYDIEYVVHTLDEYAARFKSQHSDFESMTTREKALSLLRWLRRQNLVGQELLDHSYHNLRNCFIGHTLSDPSHPALPIISSSIYACVAERLGLVSTCLAFPSHAHAVVFAPPGEDVNGNSFPPTPPEGGDNHHKSTPLSRVYLDPYGSDYEITPQSLRSKLREYGLAQYSDIYLSASSVPAIVQRAAVNIKTSWGLASSLTDARFELSRLRTGLPPGFDLHSAYYSALWAELVSKQPDSMNWDSTLDELLGQVSKKAPEDAWLVRKYLLPLYDQFAAHWPGRANERRGWRDPAQAVDMIENLDARKPEVSRRYTDQTRHKVLYKIGQVFQHKRYRYIGVINGWSCQNHALPAPAAFLVTHEDAHDMAPMQRGHRHVHGGYLNGRDSRSISNRSNPDRVFYTCMRSGYDHLTISQDNVEIITNPDLIPKQLFLIAGKFFKRFDKETCTFVSNIKEHYPDD